MKIQIEEADLRSVLEALEEMQARANFECWNLDICDEAITICEQALESKMTDKKTQVRSTEEALKLALKKAFDLGERYWSWADSEYSSHWKKADAAKEEFNQLVEDTIREALAEQPAQQQCMEHGECFGGECIYPAPQPAPVAKPHEQQEPVAWRNAALRVGEDLCSVGPFGYYDMTAEQWLDWALSVVTVHAPPASKPWVGLTLDDREKLRDQFEDWNYPSVLLSAVENILREKNQ